MSKLYFNSVIALAFILLGGFALGQCPDCEPDYSCTSADGMPALCPMVLPDATTGEYYSTTATFFMPSLIVDPSSGWEVDLNELVITGITGAPYGMEFNPSNADWTYYPSDGEEYGCVGICGTPFVAGEYFVNIQIVATVSVLGFEQVVNESFSLPFTVLQGEDVNNSFTMNPGFGCAPLDVDFEATIDDAGTSYEWTFEGQTASTSPNPSLTYNEPGTYNINLVTTVTELTLTGLNITSLADGWAGDAEENFLWGNPDPYFTIEGGSSDYVSSVVDETETPNYTGLNIPLEYGTPITFSFYDEDSVSDTDYLGSGTFTPSEPGDYTVNLGGTTVVLTIVESVGAVFEDSETLVVYETLEVYADADGDGFGDIDVVLDGCTLGPDDSYSFNGGDCNDGDATIYPGAPGTMMGIDNNCDEEISSDEELAVYGCMLDDACNYNPLANVEDNSCEYESCVGCTDPMALNYDPSNLIPDDSCIYADCYGDFNADNTVTVSDLLIMLADFGCDTDCITDLSGDGITSVADLLELLTVYGIICE